MKKKPSKKSSTKKKLMEEIVKKAEHLKRLIGRFEKLTAKKEVKKSKKKKTA